MYRAPNTIPPPKLDRFPSWVTPRNVVLLLLCLITPIVAAMVDHMLMWMLAGGLLSCFFFYLSYARRRVSNDHYGDFGTEHPPLWAEFQRVDWAQHADTSSR